MKTVVDSGPLIHLAAVLFRALARLAVPNAQGYMDLLLFGPERRHQDPGRCGNTLRIFHQRRQPPAHIRFDHFFTTLGTDARRVAALLAHKSKAQTPKRPDYLSAG